MTFQPITGVRPAAERSGPTGHGGAHGGAYGWLTPYITALAAHNEDVRARALTLPRGEVHFIALCIALMGDKAQDPDHLAAFARSYGTLSRKTLLATAAGLGRMPAHSSLAKAAFRLAGSLWRAAAYRRLAALYEETNARKALAHLPFITRRQVMQLARLPEAYRTRGVLKMLQRPGNISEVLFAIEIVRRVRTDLTDRQIIASLEKAASTNIRSWVGRHYEHAPFPEPPVGPLVVDGVEALRPLTCYADLERSALEFDNCIRSDLWTVLLGENYFYRYAPEAGGKGVAIVELKRAPVIGWVVHEALGPDNNAITGADRATILAAFGRAGIGAAPQARNPNVWFNLR